MKKLSVTEAQIERARRQLDSIGVEVPKPKERKRKKEPRKTIHIKSALFGEWFYIKPKFRRRVNIISELY